MYSKKATLGAYTFLFEVKVRGCFCVIELFGLLLLPAFVAHCRIAVISA